MRRLAIAAALSLEVAPIDGAHGTAIDGAAYDLIAADVFASNADGTLTV